MDQSSPPWRVFDSPGQVLAATAAGPPPGGSRIASANPVVAIAGVGAALVVGAIAVVVAVSGTGAGTVAGPETGLGAVGSHLPEGVAGEIVVDVAGAVIDPGVYRLPSGSRVGEAIDAAGGYSPRVDAARVSAELNLAATLPDGAQVRVPSRDETPAPVGAGGSSGAGGGLINLNTASQTELESLPGIGPVTAGKIIASRTTAPFATIEELRERGLVYEKTFEDLRALVTVG